MSTLFRDLNYCANKYSDVAGKSFLFLYKSSRKDPEYKSYEIYYRKENFMHLVGVDSKTMHALDFYEACLNNTLTQHDCSASHGNPKNIKQKTAVFPKMFDFKNAKIYQIGPQDKAYKDNKFDIAIGNNNGVIGYKRNKAINPFPATTLDNPISHYCSKPEKIFFVFSKAEKEEKYTNLHYSIKKGLLSDQINSFPKKVREKIDENVLT